MLSWDERQRFYARRGALEKQLKLAAHNYADAYLKHSPETPKFQLELTRAACEFAEYDKGCPFSVYAKNAYACPDV